ncbi:MAG: hypothetical protein Q7T56_01000 [Nocardioidaceae bacterium]|nr:hypothetical protein [Nocardioidaceae bacterium]
MKSRVLTLPATALLLAPALAACGGPDAAEAGADATPHGYVEGAQEESEAQTRLVYAAADGDRPRVLDLTTEQTVPLGPRRDETVAALAGDGRFVYVAPEGGRGLRVLDSGAWRVEHGDHAHYYRADPRPVGSVRGDSPGRVAGSGAGAAVVFEAAGEVAVLSREGLDDGEVDQTARIDVGPHAGVAVPYREHVVASVAADGAGRADAVAVFTPDGERTSEIDVRCPEVSGHALARTGVLLGCADGVLLVTEDDGTFSGEKIPYPDGTPPADRLSTLHVRPGSNSVVGAAGTSGVWTIDPSARTLALVRTSGGPVAVASPGDDRTLLVLRSDGVLESRDLATGRVLAERRVLTAPVDPRDGPAPVVEVDTTRAYVNDAAGMRVVELDYADDLRVARTFATEVAPDFMTETGR